MTPFGNPCLAFGGTESQDWAFHARACTRAGRSGTTKLQLIEESRRRGGGISNPAHHASGRASQCLWLAQDGSRRAPAVETLSFRFLYHPRRAPVTFSSVTVYPVIDQSIDIDISEKDVRIDVYRASGAGGGHVNKTESAVRTHALADRRIAVASQSERSYQANRAIRCGWLKSRSTRSSWRRRRRRPGPRSAKNPTSAGARRSVLARCSLISWLNKDLRNGRGKGLAAGRAGRRP